MADRRFVQACLLRALSGALLVAGETYAFTLFLFVYPQENIPYLYLFLAGFLFLAMHFSQPYLKSDLKRFLIWSNWTFILLLFLLSLFLRQASHFVPFIFAIFLISATLVSNTSNWIAATALFDLRELKSMGSWIAASSTLGAVLVGLLIPLLLKIFPPIILLYLNLILFLLCLPVIYSLRFSQEKSEALKEGRPAKDLRHDPLFFNTFLCVVFMLMLYYLADFTFKSQLPLHYNKPEIAEFLALFFVSTSLLTIGAQILVLPSVLKRFGVVGIMMVCPIAYILAAAVLLFFPYFWSAVLVSAVAILLRNSFFILGSQMELNVYPPALRIVAKYQIESLGRSLGIALGAIILIAFFSFSSLCGIAIELMVGGLLLMLFTFRVGKSYLETLKNAINLKRFSMAYLSTKKLDQQFVFRVAEQALRDPSEDSLLFGLSLFRRYQLKKVPELVIKALSSEFETVKISASRVMRDSGDPKVAPFLLKQLEQEKNPETVWYLVDAILAFTPQSLLTYAVVAIQSEEPAIKAAAIAIFLKSGTQAQVREAQAVLAAMVTSSDWHYRFWAAYLLRICPIPNSAELIYKLINDADERVVWKAFYAARLYPNDQIIRSLISKLSNKKFALRAGTALVGIGASVIPKLMKQFQMSKREIFESAAITTLAKFEEIEAEKALLELLRTETEPFREKVIKSLAYRAKQFSLSHHARAFIYEQLQEEVKRISILFAYKSIFKDAHILLEIESRIFYCRKRYLYLLAAYANAKIILKIIPTLLREKKGSLAYTNAIEVLELSIENQSVKEMISIVIEGKVEMPEAFPPLETFDPWLFRLVEFTRHKGTLK